MASITEIVSLFSFGVILVCSHASSNSSTTLKFLLMVASDSSPDSSAVVPAVDQTLEEINGDNSILPSHHLEYILSDTSQCNQIKTLNTFIDVATDSSVVAVVGCGCSTVTELVAKISSHFNLSVISYASTSVVLSDRSVYRSFFRTVPSDELLVSAVATIMNHYRWRQLSVFTEEQPQYLELFYILTNTLDSTVNYISRAPIKQNFHNYTILASKISHIFNAQPHIFLILASKRAATLILCAAYHNGRYYPNYAWILLGHHETDWWREHYMETNCSETDMMKVLNRSLILIPYPGNNSKQEKYTEQIQESDLYNVSAYASDAVRALAEALHNCFDNFGSGNTAASSCRGTELNWNITFKGKTGLVKLNPHNGNRVASNTLVQQHHSKANKSNLSITGAVTRSRDGTNRTLMLTNNITMWPDGVPPDGTPVAVIITLTTPIIVLQNTLVGLSLTGIAICLVFIIIFRKRKIIKLTSPNLNYFLLAGLAATALSFLDYPSTAYVVTVAECTNTKIFAYLGYDVVIGVALVKTARVYYIFKKPSPNKKIPKDWHLLLAVLLIVMVELSYVVPLLVLGLINSTVGRQQSKDHQPAFNSQGVLEILYYFRCNLSIFATLLNIITICYKVVLQAAAVVFALLIRKVQVTVLNDSRETVAIVYSSTVLLISCGLVIIVLQPTVDRFAITWSIMVFLVIAINLGFTFVTKMVALYKDPQGKDVFKKIKQQVVINNTSNNKKGRSLTSNGTIDACLNSTVT